MNQRSMADMAMYAAVKGADHTHMHMNQLILQVQHGTKNQCWKKTFTKYLFLRFSVRNVQIERGIEEKKEYENN